MLISEECLICEEYISKMQWKRVFTNFTSLKSKIALQVARRIASCVSALTEIGKDSSGEVKWKQTIVI